MINNKGQVSLLLLAISITILILALAFAPVIKEFTDNSRNVSSSTSIGLDCSNSSISNFDKANCIAVDVMNPYFIGFLLLFAGALFAAKIMGGGA